MDAHDFVKGFLSCLLEGQFLPYTSIINKNIKPITVVRSARAASNALYKKSMPLTVFKSAQIVNAEPPFSRISRTTASAAL